MDTPLLESPKYRQVFDVLQREILTGRYQPGERIPSEADLVKRFGTSRITVGRAVRELTRQELTVRRAGSGTFVRPSKSAGLTFGLLLPEAAGTDIFPLICQGMAEATQDGRHAMLWGHSPDGAPAAERAWRLCAQYIERSVSGVFFAPLEGGAEAGGANSRILAALDRARIPVVLLDRCHLPYPGRGAYDVVGIDNRRAGFLAADHLAERGARRVGFLGGLHSAPTVDARAAGWREALFSRGREARQDMAARLDPADGEAVSRFLDRARPDALVCANDRTAGALMHTLSALGKRVPEDIRLAGVDDAGYAALLPVPLTTVRQPCREIGQAAVSAMVERRARPGMPARDILLAARLVERASSGAPETFFEKPATRAPRVR